MFVIGSILPTVALDRMGRRNTMMWGSFGLGVSMLMISALLSQAGDGKTDPREGIWLSLSSLFLRVHARVWRQCQLCSMGVRL